jgi:hypothetical protein
MLLVWPAEKPCNTIYHKRIGSYCTQSWRELYLNWLKIQIIYSWECSVLRNTNTDTEVRAYLILSLFGSGSCSKSGIRNRDWESEFGNGNRNSGCLNMDASMANADRHPSQQKYSPSDLVRLSNTQYMWHECFKYTIDYLQRMSDV